MMATRDKALPIVAGCALALLFAMAALHAAGVAMDFAAAIRNPLELDYGEGIVWQQAELIPGPRMYARGTGLPFIVFHYPPLYYLLTRAALPLTSDWLAAGRLVASVSSLLMAPLLAVLIAVVTWRRGQTTLRTLVTAGTVGLMVVSLHAVHFWGFRMRVDMPGLVFVLAGLLVAVWADGRYLGTTVALLLCIAAVFTKQTLLPAGGAVVFFTLLRRPVPAIAAALTAAAAGVCVVLWLQSATDGGFLQNIFGNNINRMSLHQARRILADERLSIPVILAMLAAAPWLLYSILPSALRLQPAAAWRELLALRRGHPRHAARLLVLLYFGFATVMLITLFKVGGSFNYLLDWLCAGSLALGIMLVDLARGGRWAQAGSTVALLWLVFGIQSLPMRMMPDRPDPKDLALDQRVVELIRSSPKPVASENMTLLMRAGKGVTFEPSIVTELASVGRWDETPLVKMIRTHGFAFVLTTLGPDGYEERRTPAVNAAIQEAYPRLERLGPQTWIRYPP